MQTPAGTKNSGVLTPYPTPAQTMTCWGCCCRFTMRSSRLRGRGSRLQFLSFWWLKTCSMSNHASSENKIRRWRRRSNLRRRLKNKSNKIKNLKKLTPCIAPDASESFPRPGFALLLACATSFQGLHEEFGERMLLICQQLLPSCE